MGRLHLCKSKMTEVNVNIDPRDADTFWPSTTHSLAACVRAGHHLLTSLDGAMQHECECECDS